MFLLRSVLFFSDFARGKRNALFNQIKLVEKKLGNMLDSIDFSEATGHLTKDEILKFNDLNSELVFCHK